MTRGKYFLSIIGAAVLCLLAVPVVMGFSYGFLTGYSPPEATIEIMSIACWLSYVVFLIVIMSLRATNAGRSQAWVAVGLIIPFGWIILGCFKSRDPLDVAMELPATMTLR